MTWFYFLASLALLALALGIAQHHLGSYMARVFTSDKDTKVEAFCYRIMGVDPRAGQTWKSYARSVLAFSFCGVVLLYALQRLQSWLPWSMDKGSVNPAVAFNTAVSFVTNTNWQAYSPEATLGHFVQLAGLCVQNFVSAATGIAVAIALVRGFVGRGEHTIGNFWVDLTRTTLRILMPIAAVGAFLLIVGGAAQNFIGFMHVTGIAGGDQIIPGGPVASQEVIKELGTNGGGFFNGNSSHPFENPQPWTNMLEIFLILLIPFSLPRTFGKMVKDVRQGRAILISMIVLFLINLFAMAAAEFSCCCDSWAGSSSPVSTPPPSRWRWNGHLPRNAAWRPGSSCRWLPGPRRQSPSPSPSCWPLSGRTATPHGDGASSSSSVLR